MNNMIILPIIVPFIVGAILIIFAKHERLQRIISGITVVGMLILSIYLARIVYVDGVLVLEAGNWAAPFGIVLVADTFATLMVLLTSLLSAACLFFAFNTIAKQRERYFFYPFYFFLLVGVNGAFLTGDMFNLFVFFEVMLLASYALIVNGGTAYQLRESFKYVIINVLMSALFVVAIAWLYAVTGTLNMAHLAERVAELGQTGVVNVIAMLFFIVFAAKGALFPLYFWLTKSYSGPPAAITALFGGLLTKVGIYAIIRMFTLVFYHEPSFTHQAVMISIAGLTMLFGVLGALAQLDIKRILSYHIISHIGYMVMGLGLFTPLALAGAIYYIVHNMIVKTALFLFAGAVEKVTGTTNLRQMGGLLKTHPWLAWLFLISALSLAGIPPFSGFFSKFPIILAGFQEKHYVIAGMALLVGLLTLVSIMNVFGMAFWGKQKHSDDEAKQPIGKLLLPIAPLVALTIVLGLAAEPMFQYAMHIAEYMLDPSLYIQSVIKE